MEMHASRLFVSMKSTHFVLPRGRQASSYTSDARSWPAIHKAHVRGVLSTRKWHASSCDAAAASRGEFSLSAASGYAMPRLNLKRRVGTAGFCSSTRRVRVQAALLPGCGRILQALSVRFVANVPAGSRAAEQGGCLLWCAHDKVVARVTGTCGKPHVGASRCAASDLCRVLDGR